MIIENEIKDFDELFKIQSEQARLSESLDLLFIRHGFILVDGYALIIGTDALNHLKMYQMKTETYEKLTDSAKDYLKRHYGI